MVTCKLRLLLLLPFFILSGLSVSAQTINYVDDGGDPDDLNGGFGVSMLGGYLMFGGQVNGFINITDDLMFETASAYGWPQSMEFRNGFSYRFWDKNVLLRDEKLSVPDPNEDPMHPNKNNYYIKVDMNSIGYCAFRGGYNRQVFRGVVDNKAYFGIEFGSRYNYDARLAKKKRKVRGIDMYYADILVGTEMSYEKTKNDIRYGYKTPLAWRIGWEKYSGAMNVGFSYTAYMYHSPALLEFHFGLAGLFGK